MPKLEVEIRFLRKKTKAEIEEEKETRRIKSLLSNDDEDEDDHDEDESEKYTYDIGFIDIDQHNISFVNRLDDEHTTIRWHSNQILTIRCPYQTFRDMYQMLNSTMLTSILETNIENKE